MRLTLKRIGTIFRKDLRDALRDARVLFAVLTPLGIGVLYNITIDDEVAAPVAVVAIAVEADSAFSSVLTDMVGSAVALQLEPMTEGGVREAVAANVAHLGIVVPAGFDEELRVGAQPLVIAVLPEELTIGGEYVLAAIEPTVREMSGQQLPATLSIEVTAEQVKRQSILDRVGPRRYFVLFSQVMMIVMIGMLAIPIVLAEETEKKTIEALSLIASHREIVFAKAALGVFYVALASAILLAITRLFPENWPLYIGAVGALGVTVIGFGLLLAGVLRSASQLNTWASLMVLPVIVPAFIVGAGISDRVATIASLLPTGAAMKVMLDSGVSASLYDDTVRSFMVVLAWGLAAYLVLLWQLSRRRA